MAKIKKLDDVRTFKDLERYARNEDIPVVNGGKHVCLDCREYGGGRIAMGHASPRSRQIPKGTKCSIFRSLRSLGFRILLFLLGGTAILVTLVRFSGLG